MKFLRFLLTSCILVSPHFARAQSSAYDRYWDVLLDDAPDETQDKSSDKSSEKLSNKSQDKYQDKRPTGGKANKLNRSLLVDQPTKAQYIVTFHGLKFSQLTAITSTTTSSSSTNTTLKENTTSLGAEDFILSYGFSNNLALRLGGSLGSESTTSQTTTSGDTSTATPPVKTSASGVGDVSFDILGTVPISQFYFVYDLKYQFSPSIPTTTTVEDKKTISSIASGTIGAPELSVGGYLKPSTESTLGLSYTYLGPSTRVTKSKTEGALTETTPTETTTIFDFSSTLSLWYENDIAGNPLILTLASQAQGAGKSPAGKITESQIDYNQFSVLMRFNINKALAVDSQLFFGTGSSDLGKTKISQMGVNLGLRYVFGD